ncbi:AEC family transporter [Jeotgalibaca caeni]|uniref:AEC family transporter n=1 Tax=Jeotgalibaca caeni TaxID=3028623 RepID=UPI00237D4EB4|nr:AEC family transporter [Jeotgalibaca caeni]MDE1548988.1 AEC family transporter [Jeotgalibaca caeni]
MSMFGILLEQMLTMFTLIIFGFILVKANVINSEGARQISTILSMYVMPAAMIASFNAPFDSDRLRLFGWAVVAGLLTLGSRILLNELIFKKEDRIDKYAATFANSGFFGIPIVMSLIGLEGVFFMTAFIMCNNILQWTYGRALISGDRKAMTLKKAFTNPGMVGAIVGLAIYILQIPLPTFVWNAVDSMAALNTSLAMIIIGSYLANSNLGEIFVHWHAYKSVFMRLIVTPLLAILIIYLLPINNTEVELVLTIASVAPAAVNTAILGRLFGGDYHYGARMVVLSSIFSILTIPVIMQVAVQLFGA